MKHIKRLLALLLIVAMALAVLASCASEEPMESAGEVSDFSSEKHFDINDILQNGDESEEEPNSVGSSTGAESTDEPSASPDESSAGTTSEPVSQDQSDDETPPEESTASKPEESKENQTPSQGANSQPSQGTTSTSSQGSASENSQGTTSRPAETSQGTTSNPSQGSTSTPSQGSTSQPSQGTTGQPSGELTGEIVVSDKKYTYNGNDLMLLHVENKTALHLDITIKGKYLDKSGKVIKEESQTYYAFPSGWSNYFIFRPKMTFDSFDYSIEVKEFKSTTTRDKLYAYNGDPLSKYAELTYSKNLTWVGDYMGTESARALVCNYELLNHHPSQQLAIEFHLLILDEQGNIYATDYELIEASGFVDGVTGTIADPIGGYDDGKAMCRLKVQPLSESQEIPSNVQGKFTAIFAIIDVMDQKEVKNQLW